LFYDPGITSDLNNILLHILLRVNEQNALLIIAKRVIHERKLQQHQKEHPLVLMIVKNML